MFGDILENVRKFKPLIHSITNNVAINDVANMLLACGASPIMADAPQEAEEITAACDGLNLNMGMPSLQKTEAMLKAGACSNRLGHVLVLDPVGVGASSFRRDIARRLMKELRFDAIRGNASEIKTLATGSKALRGVDAYLSDAVTQENINDFIPFIKGFAHETRAIVALTGKIDIVGDDKTCYVIKNGDVEMRKITGVGCQLSALMTAFMAANPDRALVSAAAAVCAMGAAGEIAKDLMKAGEGNATYRNRIIDAVYNMDAQTLNSMAKYEIY